MGAYETQVYSLTLTANGAGSVAADPEAYNDVYYNPGQVVTLTATADTGSTFSGWSGDLTGSTTPITVTMDADKIVTATFTAMPVSYTLTANAVGGGTVTPASGEYLSGTLVTLTATADSGYNFSGWSGDLTGSTTPITLTMNADKVVTATFTAAGESLNQIYLPVVIK